MEKCVAEEHRMNKSQSSNLPIFQSSSPPVFQHLGPFSDLVAAANRSSHLYPLARPGRKSQRRFRQLLAFSPGPEVARGVKIEGRWRRDGVDGEEISWWVGYGPRTKAWLLRP